MVCVIKSVIIRKNPFSLFIIFSNTKESQKNVSNNSTNTNGAGLHVTITTPWSWRLNTCVVGGVAGDPKQDSSGKTPPNDLQETDHSPSCHANDTDKRGQRDNTPKVCARVRVRECACACACASVRVCVRMCARARVCA